ncbi:GNAT family N-acetyltransferase [Jeotgalicoccus huakuii]|nr:GNAT family N-acetyltransferase [Jeotgalicoccus huakuii]
MSNIELREINDENIKEVRALRINDNQKSFIETVDECLKEAEEFDEWCPVGLYHEETLVGFAMYGAFGKNPDAWIDRILIDKKYQGRGFGRASMEKLIVVVKEKYKVDKIYLSFVEENINAKNLYKSLGFKYIGEKDPNGEYIYKIDVK